MSELLERLDALVDVAEAIKARLDFGQTFDVPLNRQQAAAYLDVSAGTIDNLRRRGIIKQVTRRGLIGYLLTDLDKIRKCL